MSEFAKLVVNDYQEVIVCTNLKINLLNGQMTITLDRTVFPGWTGNNLLTSDLALGFFINQKVYVMPLMGDNINKMVEEMINLHQQANRVTIEAITKYVSPYSGARECEAMETMSCDATYLRIFPTDVTGTRWHYGSKKASFSFSNNTVTSTRLEETDTTGKIPSELMKKNVAADSLRFFKIIEEDLYTTNGVLTPYVFYIDKRSKGPDVIIHNVVKSILPCEKFCNVTLKMKDMPLSVTFPIAVTENMQTLLTEPMNQLIFTDPMFGHIYLNVSDFNIEINQ